MPTTEKRRAYAESRMADGICRDCPEPARPGKRRCQSCADKENQRSRERYAARTPPPSQNRRADCATSPTGAHHFRIADQQGTTMLPGTCKHCGTTRQFAASEEGTSTNGDRGWKANQRRRAKRALAAKASA